MKRRVFLITLIPLVLVLGLFWAIKSVLAQTTIPTDDQASSKSNLQVIRQTYNPVSSKSYATFERGDNVHVVLSVFSPSLTLGDVTVSDFASGIRVDTVKNVKYTQSDGLAGAFDFVVDYKTQTIRFNLEQVVKGENKIEYDFEVAN